MKALVYKGPREIDVEEVALPRILPGHVLIRVKMSGICGSDVHGYMGLTGRRCPGVIMGHEFSGIVERTADDVSSVRAGQRVVVQPTVYCGTCGYCRWGYTQRCPNKTFLGVFDVNGGFAEFASVPAKLVLPLPDDMSFEEGALIEPLAVSRCGVDKISDYSGKTVLVVGAGTIGLLAIAVLKARGARMIIAADLSKNRLSIARKMGAHAVFCPQETDAVQMIQKLTGEVGADVSVEAVGAAKPVEVAIGCLKPGGHCVWVGNSEKIIPLDMQSVVTREITIHGTYIYSHADFAATLAGYADMKIDAGTVISRTMTLEQAPLVIEELASGSDRLVKTMISF